MRVHIPGFYPDRGVGSGKAMFCSRLHYALAVEPNVTVVDSPEKADVQLHVIKMHNSYRGCKNVLRLNGIYFDGHDYKTRNIPMQRAMSSCDGIVYQSEFSRRMCNYYLGKAKVPCTVILNGANPSELTDVAKTSLSCEHLFIAFSRWRPHKRLTDAIESFLEADIPNSTLLIAGGLTNSGLSPAVKRRYFSLPHVIFAGQLHPDKLYSYLTVAKASLHLSPCDWCPNSVVEAVCLKIPVICSNAGGTKEIVEPSGGIVCKIDSETSYRPVRLHPPSINRSLVANALHQCLTPRLISYQHVDIRVVARSYVKFFEEVMS